MANKRMITSDLFEDDICAESFFTRLLWIGMITAVADDQGRMLDNPAILRAKIFPLDNDVTDGQILDALIKIGRSIYRYSSADGKKLIQIVKWWDYQTPSWAAPSRFQPPPNWIDRVRVHIIGNRVRLDHWDDTGGFVRSNLPTSQGSAIDESDVKSDINGEGEEEDSALFTSIQRMLEKAIGLPAANVNDMKAIDEISAMNPLQEDIDSAAEWLRGQGKTVIYYSSLVNPVRVSIAKRTQTKKGKLDTIAEKNAAVIAEFLAKQEVVDG